MLAAFCSLPGRGGDATPTFGVADAKPEAPPDGKLNCSGSCSVGDAGADMLKEKAGSSEDDDEDDEESYPQSESFDDAAMRAIVPPKFQFALPSGPKTTTESPSPVPSILASSVPSSASSSPSPQPIDPRHSQSRATSARLRKSVDSSSGGGGVATGPQGTPRARQAGGGDASSRGSTMSGVGPAASMRLTASPMLLDLGRMNLDSDRNRWNFDLSDRTNNVASSFEV